MWRTVLDIQSVRPRTKSLIDCELDLFTLLREVNILHHSCTCGINAREDYQGNSDNDRHEGDDDDNDDYGDDDDDDDDDAG